MKVTLENGRELEIQRLPLGRYAELLQALQELPKQLTTLKNFDTLSNEEMFGMLPGIIGKCMPDFIRILPIVTPLTPEEVDQLSFSDVVEIITAVIQENNFQVAFEKLKKFLAQRNLLKNSQPQS